MLSSPPRLTSISRVRRWPLSGLCSSSVCFPGATPRSTGVRPIGAPSSLASAHGSTFTRSRPGVAAGAPARPAAQDAALTSFQTFTRFSMFSGVFKENQDVRRRFMDMIANK